jgi:hypothetical protein
MGGIGCGFCLAGFLWLASRWPGDDDSPYRVRFVYVWFALYAACVLQLWDGGSLTSWRGLLSGWMVVVFFASACVAFQGMVLVKIVQGLIFERGKRESTSRAVGQDQTGARAVGGTAA